jgi:outer membrane murein-binding lipoprotein Lpp
MSKESGTPFGCCLEQLICQIQVELRSLHNKMDRLSDKVEQQHVEQTASRQSLLEALRSSENKRLH